MVRADLLKFQSGVQWKDQGWPFSILTLSRQVSKKQWGLCNKSQYIGGKGFSFLDILGKDKQKGFLLLNSNALNHSGFVSIFFLWFWTFMVLNNSLIWNIKINKRLHTEALSSKKQKVPIYELCIMLGCSTLCTCLFVGFMLRPHLCCSWKTCKFDLDIILFTESMQILGALIE